LAGLGSLVFIAVGSYLSLREVLSPLKSGLVMGSILAGLSIIGILITWFLVQRRNHARSTNPKPEDVPVDTIASLGETIGYGLGERGVRQTDVVIAALVAGTVLGASPVLRDRLFGLNIDKSRAARPKSYRYYSRK
jgi:xanthine/uracil permease